MSAQLLVFPHRDPVVAARLGWEIAMKELEQAEADRDMRRPETMRRYYDARRLERELWTRYWKLSRGY